MNELKDIDLTKPVQVYRNLNKPGVQFSVRQGGKVRCYVDRITLKTAIFKHATPKQLDAVRSGPRQVCQWITGLICDSDAKEGMMFNRIACDPKTADGFQVDGKRINNAALVAVTQTGCWTIT